MQFGVNKQEHIFFKDKKIARARRVSAICSLKNLQVLITTNCWGNHVITCYNVQEKNMAAVEDRRNFESVRAVFVICPRVTTLDLRYDFAFVLHENALVSANQKRIIFLCTLLIKLFIYNTYPDSIRVKFFLGIQSTLSSFVLIKEIIYVPSIHIYM